MAFSTGFFTRTEIKSRVSKSTDSGLTLEESRRLGLAGTRNMNPDARSKHIQPVGAKRPDIYVLTAAPTVEDDDSGNAFDSPVGRFIREALPTGNKYRFGYVCQTLPPVRNRTRRPIPHEIAGYLDTVVRDVETSAPFGLITVGAVATGWALGETAARAGIDNTRGRRFPGRVGNLSVWVYPVMDAADIMAMETSRAYQSIPAAEYRRYFEMDMARAVDDFNAGLKPPVIEPPDLATGLRGVLIEKRSINIIRNFLAEMRDERAVTIDLETNAYRPFTDGAKILTQAIGTGERVIAFPWKHKDAGWTRHEHVLLREIVGNFLISKVPKIAHNAPFEIEWLVNEFGTPVAWESYWHDTMGMQYICDERSSSSTKRKGGESGGSGISLNFCCTLHFGLDLKGLERVSKTGNFGYEIGMGKIDRSDLANTDLDAVLRYDGRDTKYTGRLYPILKEELRRRGLWQAYLQWGKRVPCLAQAQVIGVPVDQKINAQLRERVGGEIAAADVEIQKTDAVKRFQKLYGPYIDSNKNNLVLFRDMLGYKNEIFRKGKWTVDEQALSQLKGEPVAAALLKRRGVATLYKTYLARMDAKHPETFIFSDGKVHTSFKHAATDTKRIQAEEPSLLNQPREASWIKTQYVAEPGALCLFNDYGAQEARCITVMSKDPNLIRFMKTGEDFHMTWAVKIAQAYDKTYKAFTKHLPPEKRMKAWRQRVKAQWVFAGFYYAKVSTRANYLEMPVKIAQKLDDEFWDKRDGFGGVKTWQRWLIENYREKGYVESMGGHRRYGPMSESQIANTGVQMSGTDVTCDAWYRVCRHAYENDLPWLFPPIFVHDDLGLFSVPKDKRDDAVEIMSRIMCDVQLPGAELIPWETEIAEGPSWGQKKTIGVFRTDKIDKQIKVFRQSGVEGLEAYSKVGH